MTVLISPNLPVVLFYKKCTFFSLSLYKARLHLRV